MRENDVELRRGLPSFTTLGVYVTTKGVPGSKPKILRSQVKDEFFVGRAGSICDIVVPQPYVSAVHLKIVHSDDRWHVQNLGSNATYYERGDKLTKLVRGADFEVMTGDVVYLLYPRPMYCFEFHPGLDEVTEIVNSEPTKSGSNDLSYIDTRFELIAYLASLAASVSLIRLILVLSTLVLLFYIWRLSS